MTSQIWLARSAAILLLCVGGAMTLSGATAAASADVVLNAPIVELAATPDGHGYWEVAADGGVFAFGDASFYGSIGDQHLNAAVVGLAPTPDGRGYWEVAADGGVFAFGDASFYGSIGGQHLNAPIVELATTPDGHGYWEVAADGGVFAFGDASFYGSHRGTPGLGPVTGIAGSADGHGYWEVAADGGVFSYGDTGFFGSLGGAWATPPAATSGPFSLPSPWGCIAVHESGGDPNTDTGNGYFGLFQFSIASWKGAGGPPGLPSDYSAAVQLQIAENLQAMQGWGAWPVSSRLCGV